MSAESSASFKQIQPLFLRYI